MQVSRRKFLAAGGTALAPFILQAGPLHLPAFKTTADLPKDRFDPWLEIDPAALHANINTLSALAGNRPIIAVVKNNSYGLGISFTPKLIESSEKVAGFAVVKTEECYRLLEQGIKKPVMLLALPNERDEFDLVRQGIELCVFTGDVADKLRKYASALQRKIKVHVYVDTGMSRVGIPYHRASAWLAGLAAMPEVEIRSTFTDLTEDAGFDVEQVNRLQGLVGEIKRAGLSAGRLHAASSNGIYHVPQTHLDVVRPGISIFGAYPTHDEVEKKKARLNCAYRLRARVVRVEQLRKGDSVSYGRNYVADKPTWIATLPVGHADGYPRGAVKGAKVVIGEALYPVVGAVSASHCIVVVGDEPKVNAGDLATLVGPDHAAIEPNTVNKAAGISVYDVLMHMNPDLPKFIAQK
jgi:alanine racemase